MKREEGAKRIVDLTKKIDNLIDEELKEWPEGTSIMLRHPDDFFGRSNNGRYVAVSVAVNASEVEP